MNKIKVKKIYSTTPTRPKTCDSFSPYLEENDEFNSTFEFF